MVQNTYEKKVSSFGIRHLQCAILFFGLAVVFGLRINLSVAIVAMTEDAEYKWSEKIKSYVLSSFFWGYFMTQVPGGQLARKFGGKLLLLQAIFISSALAILTPLATHIGNWQLLCALRFTQGLSQGVIYPSTHTILSKWAPVEERGVLSTYCYTGSKLGTVAILASSGFLAASSYGWPSIFYVSGALGLVWSVIWFVWGASMPSDYKKITLEEKKFIESSLCQDAAHEERRRTMRTPWCAILTSKPFLVLVIAHCTHNWGYWTLLTQIPSYMKHILQMDIKSNALLSSIPYLAMFILSFVFCAISNVLQKRECISLTTSRKLFNTISQWIPMLTLIALGYVSAEHSNVAVILLVITIGLNAASFLGFQVNHIDLSPNFAGLLMGLTNSAANIINCITPLVVGFIVKDENDASQWRIVFFIASGVYLMGNLLFIIFGKANVQPWNEPPEPTTEQELKLMNVQANTVTSI